jgi:hypothetical protein
LFGLEKLHDPARSVQQLAHALDEMGYVTVEKREAATV